MLSAWEEFSKGKKQKTDVCEFSQNLLLNIFALHNDLVNFTYKHSSYQQFKINDPKERVIHKAEVRDRLVHHAVYRILYQIFDKSFIYDSYSCRLGKGTHRAVDRLEKFTRKVIKNYTASCIVLKCDVRKFFDSVDRKILFEIIKKKICDKDVLWLVWEIIYSFDCGIQIGNLTSQLFANVYLNELDQFIKHRLKIKYYLRYCDDFVIINSDILELEILVPKITDFLLDKLKLGLHPDKIIIRKLNHGIDFLGYVTSPHYRVLRTKTKKRMLKRINLQNLPSYLGLLKHCNSYKLRKILIKFVEFDFLEKKH